MSAFNLKHNHFWLNWTHISEGAGLNFSLLPFFFYVSFIHSSLKYIKKADPHAEGHNWSPADWKFPLKGPDLAKVQEVVKNSFHKIMLPSVFQKCNPIASHQAHRSVAECRRYQCQSSRFIPKRWAAWLYTSKSNRGVGHGQSTPQGSWAGLWLGEILSRIHLRFSLQKIAARSSSNDTGSKRPRQNGRQLEGCTSTNIKQF